MEKEGRGMGWRERRGERDGEIKRKRKTQGIDVGRGDEGKER